MKVFSVLGEYKDFASARINYAKEFVTKPNEAVTMPKTNPINVPLFSKAAFNMLKVMIMEFFRKKSPEEKEMEKIIKSEISKKNLT